MKEVVIFMGKRSNWNKIKSDGRTRRDVHEEQNFDRGQQGESTTKTGGRILTTLVTIGVMVLAVFVVSLFFTVRHWLGNMSASGTSISDLILNGPNFSSGLSYSEYTAGMWLSLVGTVGFSGLLAWVIMWQKTAMSWKSENALNDQSDINPYMNDQRIMLPEEVMRTFDWFPDAGAHSSVSVSSMISHVAISKKGIKSVKRPVRYEKDTVVKRKDENGDTHTQKYFKGDVVRNDSGEVVYETVPLIDEAFAGDLFSASGVTIEYKEDRVPFDVRKIPYNPKNVEGIRENRDKLDYDTVGELINNDWELPEYETQRPGGAYIVDTAPVNTMVLAITRGGKGYLAQYV